MGEKSRKRRILVIGSDEFNHSTADVEVRSFSWLEILSSDNWADFDVIMISLMNVDGDLGPQSPDTKFGKELRERFHPATFLTTDADARHVLILGNPQRHISYALPEGGRSGIHFLSWTLLDIEWINLPGTGVSLPHESYREDSWWKDFGCNLRSYRYACHALCVSARSAGLFNMVGPDGGSPSFRLEEKRLLVNRSGDGVVFTVGISSFATYRNRRGWWNGAYTFLNPLESSEHDNIRRVLSGFCGIQLKASPPAWVEARQMPDEKPLREATESLEKQQRLLSADIGNNRLKIAEIRRPLKLLYSSDKELETEVRATLKALGAIVEVSDRGGRDDGRLIVDLDEGQERAVIEIKSTSKNQFSKDGLRQLAEWQASAVNETNFRHKKIFVGNSEPEVEPENRSSPFADDWIKSAVLQNVCAFTSETLLDVYCADQENRLDRAQFWRIVFGADGVADFSSAIRTQ